MSENHSMFAKTISIIALTIALTSCGSIEINLPKKNDTPVATKNTSSNPLNACPNVPPSEVDIFPEYNSFISGMLNTAVAIPSNMTKSIDMREPQIGFINAMSLYKKEINPSGNSIVIIWSTYYTDIELDFSEINKLYKNEKNNIYLICTDLCSDAQIKLLKKYYESKNFFEKSYILYYELDNVLSIKKELENKKQLNQFINKLVPNEEKYNLPYLILVDKEKNILFSNSIQKIQADTIENIFKTQSKPSTNIKFFQNFIASKGVLKNDTNESENIHLSTFESRLNNNSPTDQTYNMSKVILNVDNDAEKMENNRIYSISIDSLKQMLTSNKKRKLIVFWGAWCPATSYEIEKFKELCPKNNEYSTYFISVDCNTTKQKNVIRAFYDKLNIKCDAYIFDSEINNPNNWIDKVQSNLIDFIKVFDKEFTEFTLPYTAVLDENNKILYSKWCLPPAKEEEASIDKAKFLEKNAKNDFEKIKELLGK